ncbi:PTS system, cellobiose-specific IIB component [Thermoanaerobacter thermohydrosulfuricus]|nr:PTS system, cellobiose-specific IIB component [Thermoanaerobacter thermohydrosulfuricus]
MNILLICAAGMSTSLVAANMKKFAEPGTKINTVAFSESEVENLIKEYDVVLVGPQLRYKLNSIKKIAEPLNKPVAVIDAVAYGRLDGKSIYEFAKKIYSESIKNS